MPAGSVWLLLVCLDISQDINTIHKSIEGHIAYPEPVIKRLRGGLCCDNSSCLNSRTHEIWFNDKDRTLDKIGEQR